MIAIAYLADHPEVIPTLVEWFRAQWPTYFTDRTPANIAQDFYEETKRNDLPIRLVAFTEGKLAGTITLREHALRDFPAYRPGLGGLLVWERYRGRGVGTELVKAGMNLAREQGYGKVYATTVTAKGILERLGWQWVQAITHENEQLNLYRCDLKK